MILSYLYDIKELNKMADGIIISIYNYSFSMPKMFEVDEVLKIKELTEKPLYININPIYHDKDLKDLKDIIYKLRDMDGFLFQDLGLIEYFAEFNILNKCIYYPETFNTTHLDSKFFNKININSLVLSREITLSDILSILSIDKNTNYFYSGFGYQMMFYSLRPHITNYYKTYNISENPKGFNYSIKELTRNEYYKVVEDNLGFRCYKDKIFNSIEELNNLENLNIILDRIFIDDEMYFDAIDLFKNKISISSFYSKYDKGLFDKSYLFKETGLLK